MEPYLYIPFADGVIGYDCIACGAGCCQDGLLGVGPKERPFLTEKYPDLGYFIKESASEDGLHFYEKFKPRCWFLREDKLCSIEKDFGRHHKPLLCRTHPVYFTPLFHQNILLTWLGPVCSWKTTGDLSDATNLVTWDEIDAIHRENLDISYYQTLPLSSQAMDAVKRFTDILNFRTVIKAEERIRDAWKDFDGYDDYLIWQLAYSNAFLISGDPGISVSSEELDRATATIHEISRLVSPFLEIEKRAPLERENQRALFLFTPILRLAWMGLIVEMPESIVLSNVHPLMVYQTIPKALFIMSLFALLFSRVKPSPRTPIDYNMFIQMHLNLSLRIFTLACFSSTIDLGPMGKGLMERERNSDIDAFLGFLDKRDAAPLGNHITAFCKDFTMEEKMIFLDDAGRLIKRLHLLPELFS